MFAYPIGSGCTPVKFVYSLGKSEERLVVTFPKGLGGSPIFGEFSFLETVMKTIGIIIPAEHRKNYPELSLNPGRRAIYPQDPSFGKAFCQIYCTMELSAPKRFTWIHLPKEFSSKT